MVVRLIVLTLRDAMPRSIGSRRDRATTYPPALQLMPQFLGSIARSADIARRTVHSGFLSFKCTILSINHPAAGPNKVQRTAQGAPSFNLTRCLVAWYFCHVSCGIIAQWVCSVGEKPVWKEATSTDFYLALSLSFSGNADI